MSSLNLSGWTAVMVSFAAAALVTWYFLPLVVKIASLRNLTDKPCERKIHKRAIPTLGGIGIFIGFSFGFLLIIGVQMKGLAFFLLSLLLLLFVGISDDLINIKPFKKLFAEILSAFILVFFTDIRLTSFHGFLGIEEIPLWLTYASTIFAVVIITNALNLIDGIDGLAASTGIIASFTLCTWFLLAGDYSYAAMASALGGTLLIFLFFNCSAGKNKIFMGDTGALIIGFILVVMLLHFNESCIGSKKFPSLMSSPAISTAILIVPLFDTLRVFTIRILHKQHPFTADNKHIHHLMLRAGYSHKKATLLISMAHIAIILLAFRLDDIGICPLMILLLLLCIFLTGIIYIIIYFKAASMATVKTLKKPVSIGQIFKI